MYLLLNRSTVRTPQKWEKNLGCAGVPDHCKGRLASFMQRLFSMFPSGAPGLALLGLRLLTIVWLHLDGAARFALSPHWLALILVEVCSLALLIGVFTPFATGIAGVTRAIDLFVGGAFPSVLGAIAVAHFVILLILGPGAYSVDARLFGRRVTVLTAPPP
jgi:uncharacterized membrane protein YphA (DoxX/SURF4 family)